jgi:hypothetical protein
MKRTHGIAIALATVLMATVANAASSDHREVQAPRSQDDVQAPRGQDQVQAPRGSDGHDA